MKSSILALSMLAMVSCSESDFSSGGVGSKKKTEPKAPVKNDTAEPSDAVSIDQSEGKIDIKQFYNKCWFAVSGGFPGKNGLYDTTFRSKLSTNQIQHNDTFDNKGGRFLHPREEPYVFGQGGFIDLAIQWTFDGIMVPPGMHVEIKDGNGKQIISVDGPYIGVDWDGLGYKEELKKDPPTEWIKEYLANKSVEVVKLYGGSGYRTTPLTEDAQWVKVTAISGGPCDVKVGQ